MKNARLLHILLITGLGLALVFICGFSYRYGWQWLDSDNSAEMVLGKLLADENVLVSVNWLYSTEIRLIYQTIFTMPLFKLFGGLENWALVRSLNILLNNVLLILSYIFMMKGLRIQLKWVLGSAFFLLLPLSIFYWDIVTFGGFYVFLVIQLFISLGLFTRIVYGSGTSKIKTIYLILFLALAFCLGIQSIRSLLAVQIPLLLACFFLWRKQNIRNIAVGGFGFAACCAGYGLNKILHFWYSFKSFEDMRIDNIFSNFTQKLGRCFTAVIEYFGFSVGGSFFSLNGIFSMVSIIITFIFLYLVFKAFMRARPTDAGMKIQQNSLIQLPPEHYFMIVFFVCSFALNIFIFMMVDQQIVNRYFIPFLVLSVPLAAILFQYISKAYSRLKVIAIVSVIVLFIFGQGCVNFVNLAGKNLNSIRNGYIQYLLDNELFFGFAVHKNTVMTTEMSNGKIELASLDARIRTGSESGAFIMFDSLMKIKFSDSSKLLDPSFKPHRSAYEGESFILLDRDDWELTRRRRYFIGVAPDYEDVNFVILRFPSALVIYRDLIL